MKEVSRPRRLHSLNSRATGTCATTLWDVLRKTEDMAEEKVVR